MEMPQNQHIMDTFDSFIAQGFDPAAQYTDTEISFSSEASSSSSSAGSSPTTFTWAPESAPDLDSLKAGICPQCLHPDNTLLRSGPYFDFETRCCDECRAQREPLISHPVAGDPAAEPESLESGSRDEEAPVVNLVVDEEEAQEQGEKGLVANSGAVYLPVFSPVEKGFTESPPAMSADESIVREEFDGRRVRFQSGFFVFCDSDSSDGCSEYRYLSSDSEACSALLIEEEARGSLPEYEGDDEEADEMTIKDIGVSFSRQHFWVGEDFAL